MQKNSLLISTLVISLLLLLFTGIFYLIKRPEINFNKLIWSPSQDLENEAETFNPAVLAWQEATSSAIWPARDSHAVVVFKNKIWLTGGLNGDANVLAPNAVEYWNSLYFKDIWSSENGLDWTLVATNTPWSNRRSIQIVEFKNKLWLMGGWGPYINYKNDIWASEDGINWTKATTSAAWPAREGHILLAFQDKMWLIGGVRYDKKKTFNDVWYSQDGINWQMATDSAAWTSRWDHAMAVFDGKMWLTGGMDLKDKIFNDVWYSQDGINWQMATDSAAWTSRQGHNLLVYKNYLWILGRFNDKINDGANDVWYSKDGFIWQKTEKDPGWLGREDSGAVIFNDKMWILGGMNSKWQWTNDIWYSTTTK
jgi:leucine-zipper-like transcriptional regulator 1